MSKTRNRNRVSAQAAVVLAQTETSKPAPVATVTPAKDSIRQTIRQGLLAGQDTATLTASLQAKFPTSKAALKAPKHIAFYRSKLRAEGLLPKRGVAVVAETTDAAE